jgi:hypothetical protein
VVSAPIETVVQAARKLAPALRELADIGHKQEAKRLHALLKSSVKTAQAALCDHIRRTYVSPRTAHWVGACAGMCDCSSRSVSMTSSGKTGARQFRAIGTRMTS